MFNNWRRHCDFFSAYKYTNLSHFFFIFFFYKHLEKFHNHFVVDVKETVRHGIVLTKLMWKCNNSLSSKNQGPHCIQPQIDEAKNSRVSKGITQVLVVRLHNSAVIVATAPGSFFRCRIYVLQISSLVLRAFLF